MTEPLAPMHFEKSPSTMGLLWKAATARKKGMFARDGMRRFEAAMTCDVGDELAKYETLCGFDSQGYLPMAYPHVLAAPLHLAIATHTSFPLPAMGLIHAKNRIVQHRRIRADETLHLRCWIEGHRVASVGVEADLMTEVMIEDRLVWESSTTILSRAVEGDGVKRPRAETPDMAFAVDTEWDLPSNLGRQYGGLSKDYNPIHLYPWTAKLFGFKRQIAHGMCLLAKAVAEIDAPEEGALVLDVAFRKPVFLPTRVRLVAGAHAEGQAFRLLSDQGRVHFQGWLGPLEQKDTA